MKRDPLLKHCLIGFGLALAIYLSSYHWIEHLRTRKGGWQVTFRSDSNGTPALEVTQPKLRISNLTLAFPGQRISLTGLLATVVFDRPITNVPFGKVVYFDTTFLPGSMVFDLFGHEVQLLPRVLLLDRREVPWQSGTTIRLSGTNAVSKAEP